MVARLAVLLDRGVPPDRICVVTFNRDAARDLSGRVRRRLGTDVASGSIEIRTLHALARQVLLDAGEGTNLVADRLPLLRAARRRHAEADPSAVVPEVAELDTWLSASKIEGRPAARHRPRHPRGLCRPAGLAWSDRLRRPRRPRRRPPRDRTARAAALAVPLQPRLRGRVPGRRRRTAPAGPAARRARGQPVRGRRRRPDDLRVAPRRRASDPAVLCRLPDRPPRHARHELPVPRGHRRRLRAHGRSQPRALREADPRSRGQSPGRDRDLRVEHCRCGLA